MDRPSDADSGDLFEIAISDHQLPNLESDPNVPPFCAATTLHPLELTAYGSERSGVGPVCFSAQRPERPTPPRRRGASLRRKKNAAPTLFSSRRFCYLGRIATNIDHDIAATGKEHWPREISYRGVPARRDRFAPHGNRTSQFPVRTGTNTEFFPARAGKCVVSQGNLLFVVSMRLKW